MPVDRTARGAGSLGNLVERGPGDTLFVEHLLRSVQQTVARCKRIFFRSSCQDVFPSIVEPGHATLRHASRRLADRKSTRLNSSHQIISYAVFCLKKKKKK